MERQSPDAKTPADVRVKERSPLRPELTQLDLILEVRSSTEAVRKRRTCVITPFRHARKRLGEPTTALCATAAGDGFIEVVSKVARRMRLAARLARFIAQE